MSNDTQTLTLTDFLLARIAEDEAEATEVHLVDCVLDHIDGRNGCTCTIPARVLAECEAKRRIVDKVYDVRGVAGIHLDEVLRLLALPFADHPDYRDEWRP